MQWGEGLEKEAAGWEAGVDCCQAKWGRQVTGVAWRSGYWLLAMNARPVPAAWQAWDESKKAKDEVDGKAKSGTALSGMQRSGRRKV